MAETWRGRRRHHRPSRPAEVAIPFPWAACAIGPPQHLPIVARWMPEWGDGRQPRWPRRSAGQGSAARDLGGAANRRAIQAAAVPLPLKKAVRPSSMAARRAGLGHGTPRLWSRPISLLGQLLEMAGRRDAVGCGPALAIQPPDRPGSAPLDPRNAARRVADGAGLGWSQLGTKICCVISDDDGRRAL